MLTRKIIIIIIASIYWSMAQRSHATLTSRLSGHLDGSFFASTKYSYSLFSFRSDYFVFYEYEYESKLHWWALPVIKEPQIHLSWNHGSVHRVYQNNKSERYITEMKEKLKSKEFIQCCWPFSKNSPSS